jgi:hypothetical protein
LTEAQRAWPLGERTTYQVRDAVPAGSIIRYDGATANDPVYQYTKQEDGRWHQVSGGGRHGARDFGTSVSGDPYVLHSVPASATPPAVESQVGQTLRDNDHGLSLPIGSTVRSTQDGSVYTRTQEGWTCNGANYSHFAFPTTKEIRSIGEKQPDPF